jgi:hypothetical protein
MLNFTQSWKWNQKHKETSPCTVTNTITSQKMVGVVGCVCNPSTGEAGEGGLTVPGQPGLCSKTLFHKTKRKKESKKKPQTPWMGMWMSAVIPEKGFPQKFKDGFALLPSGCLSKGVEMRMSESGICVPCSLHHCPRQPEGGWIRCPSRRVDGVLLNSERWTLYNLTLICNLEKPNSQAQGRMVDGRVGEGRAVVKFRWQCE